MNKRKSQAWKDLERAAAAALGGRRITEPWQLFHERPDVVAELPDGMGRLVCECKYRTRFSHHSILDDCATRYCQGSNDIPILVSKSHNQVGAYITMPLDFFSELLKGHKTWNT